MLARQKKLGIVPASTTLPVTQYRRIKPWDSLSAIEKKVFARFFEAYAGFLSHTDYEIGRLIKAYLKNIDQLNNTTVVLIIGDNGASKEGGINRSCYGINEYIDGSLFTRKILKTVFRRSQKLYDDIGSAKTGPNYPAGWAQAANTPFRYLKQDANSEGGTRNPLVLFYPNGIKEKGIRTQYSHINSVTPNALLTLRILLCLQRSMATNGNRWKGLVLATRLTNAKLPVNIMYSILKSVAAGPFIKMAGKQKYTTAMALHSPMTNGSCITSQKISTNKKIWLLPSPAN